MIQQGRHWNGVLLLAFLLFCASRAEATVYTYVTIPTDSSIETDLMSTFPTGIFTANNALATPFIIPSAPGNCGPARNSPCNYYHFGLTDSGTSLTIDTSVASPTDVYTLMNAYDPASVQQLATIKFVGTGGASITFPLIGGQDIRDVHQSVFADTLSNGVPGVQALNAFSCVVPTNCTDESGLAPNGNYFIDEQHFSLGATFAGQTLTQIIITDTFNGSEPILLGVTVGSASEATPAIDAGGVVSASAFGAFTSVAPGSWIEIYGSNLAPDTESWVNFFSGINAPTAVDGTSVMIGGEKAFVDFVSPGQVDAQVPFDVATGTQQITLETATGTSAPVNVTVNSVEPGLLAPASFKIGGVQYAAALFLDNAYVLPEGAIAGLNSRPAKPGDTIVFYGVGFGPVTPSIPAGQIVQQANTLASKFEMSIGGTQVTVTYDGLAPSAIGLYQFNVTVPNIADNNAALVVFTLDGVPGTQSLSIPVQN